VPFQLSVSKPWLFSLKDLMIAALIP